MENGNMQTRTNQSPWVSVFNLCNAAIGAGVLSFPYGFRQTGVLGGLFFTFVIWAIEAFALCLLIRVAERYDSKSYQQLVFSVFGSEMAIVTSVTMITFLIGSMVSYLIITGVIHSCHRVCFIGLEEFYMQQQLVLSTLGPNMAVLTSVVMLILTYGGGISYLLITGDVFQPAFADLFGEGSILANRRVVIILFAVLVILPLALQKTLSALRYTSTISVVMLSYLTIALIVIGLNKVISTGIPSDILIWQAGQHAFVIIDIAVFAFQCHIQVVPIFAELADNPRPFFCRGRRAIEQPLLGRSDRYSSPTSERLKRMDGVILVSMSICFIGYCMVGEFGYLIFPGVDSDVLKNFGNSNPFMIFARYGMAAVAMACYPLQSHPARSIIDDAWRSIKDISGNGFSWTRHIVFTMIFFVSTLGVALVITDLGTVFSIVGSTGGVMVVFVIPGVLLIRGLYRSPRGYDAQPTDEAQTESARFSTRSPKWVQVVGGSLLIALGILIFMATTYVTATGMIS